MPDLPGLSGPSVTLDDDHAVADGGLALVGVLSEKPGLEDLGEELIDIESFSGRRVTSLVHALVTEPPSSTTPTYRARVPPRGFSLAGR
jgi:hypothetical protein